MWNKLKRKRENDMRKVGLILILLLAGCQPGSVTPTTPVPPTPQPATVTIAPPTPLPSTPTFIPPSPSPTVVSFVPNFSHIVFIVFENREFGSVVDNPKMPYFNELAKEYTLLTQHYAVIHPSLPNYIALMGGDTFGIKTNAEDQSVDAVSFPDLVEQSGRTWKTYQEDLPEPCFEGSTSTYAKKHNPFIYFAPIRTDTARCNRTIVPLTELYTDLAQNTLPDFVFITPNICNDAHDCSLDIADQWLRKLNVKLLDYLNKSGEPYLMLITFEEGQGNSSCCGLPAKAGGRVPTVLVSPQVKAGFQDDTQYTHYSVLKTISEAWGLPYLGKAAEEQNVLIEKPWK
jgi:phosphatidylinositol-3-phosphatase